MEVTDQQFEKFFESGGEEGILNAPESNENQEIQTEQVEQPEAKAEEIQQQETVTQEQTQTDHERNYKAAMHEEREKRRQYERELQEERVRKIQLEDQLKKLNELIEQSRQQQSKVPSFDEDPIEHLRQRQEQIDRENQIRKQYEQQQIQHYQQEQQVQQIVNDYQRDAVEYRQKNPEFNDAYQFLVKNRQEMYKSIGYSDQEALDILHREEINVVALAKRDGVNAAERIFNLAKMSGYQNKSAQAPANSQPEQKLAQLEKGLQAAKSLNATAGKTQLNDSSLEALAEMDDDEFLKNWDKIIKSVK